MNSHSVTNAVRRPIFFSSGVLIVIFMLLASPLPARAQRLVTGQDHSCALTPGGGVKCWGKNISGQLGDGTRIQRNTPVDVIGLASGVTAITSGNGHVCALTNAGGIKCWGFGTYGQLGVNSFDEHTSPIDVIGLSSGVVAIAAGEFHTCAITSAGALVCWGDNSYGQLGDNSFVPRSSPNPVVGLGSGIAVVDAGFAHTCAASTTGATKCWGYNQNGQLGDGSTTLRQLAVDVVGLASGVTSLALGYGFTCAGDTNGLIRCWGNNFWGQLGINSTLQQLTPTPVVGTPFVDILIFKSGFD